MVLRWIKRGHIGALELGDHLGPGHVSAPIHLDTMKIDSVAAERNSDFVHHPEAAAIDGALIHFEFFRQLLGVDLLVVVRADREGCRRIDVSPLGLADADEGADVRGRRHRGCC